MRSCESTDVMQNSGTAVLRPDVVEALGMTCDMRRWDESKDAMRDTATALLHPDIVEAFGITCDMRLWESFSLQDFVGTVVVLRPDFAESSSYAVSDASAGQRRCKDIQDG